jgi:hypothetical protein
LPQWDASSADYLKMSWSNRAFDVRTALIQARRLVLAAAP